MTFLQAADTTMKPNVWLNSKEVWENMEHLVKTKGKTPWSTVGNVIHMDIKSGNTEFSIKKIKGKALYMRNTKISLFRKILNAIT